MNAYMYLIWQCEMPRATKTRQKIGSSISASSTRIMRVVCCSRSGLFPLSVETMHEHSEFLLFVSARHIHSNDVRASSNEDSDFPLGTK